MQECTILYTKNVHFCIPCLYIFVVIVNQCVKIVATILFSLLIHSSEYL